MTQETTGVAPPGIPEYRMFGSPGCGKTTALAASVRKRVEEHGATGIMIGSFTKSAAAEIAGRGLPIDQHSIGTLHALAYRTMDRPELVAEHLHDWNREHDPRLALSIGYTPVMDEMQPAETQFGATEADKYVNEIEVLRARRVPVEGWRNTLRDFWNQWSTWKTQNGYLDFTDMIELAIDNDVPPPGNPRIAYFDEAQDFTPLELALVRHWSKGLERVTLCGDDDQVLYGFRGAVPDAFLDPPVDDDHKWILPQSYRVPRAVHAVAVAWIEQVTRREPKPYLPRDADGTITEAAGDMKLGSPALVRDIRTRLDAGRSVMVQASCGYMLDSLKHALRASGVPFSNPWRTSRKDWNPLAPPNRNQTSSAQRLIAYLIIDRELFGDRARLWTGDDVRKWTSAVRKQGVFRRGVAGAIAGLPDRTLAYDEVASLFDNEQALEEAVAPSLAWFKQNLLAGSAKAMEYPIAVAEHYGPQALTDAPKLYLGTIHSFKGAEADDVLLMPDLSREGQKELHSPTHRDSIIRQFYVAMTRTRENLVLLPPSSYVALPPSVLLGRDPL